MCDGLDQGGEAGAQGEEEKEEQEEEDEEEEEESEGVQRSATFLSPTLARIFRGFFRPRLEFSSGGLGNV